MAGVDVAETLTTVTLPDGIIMDTILPRLPVKALIRFKSVSKYWYSTISSPEFVKTQLISSSSSINSLKFIILTEQPSKFMILSSHDDEPQTPPVAVVSDFTLLQKREPSYVQFVGSSNGLVCLYIHYDRFKNGGFKFDYSHFFICNPALHQCSNTVDVPPNLLFSKSLHFWFGCVPSVDDYKIVALFTLKNCRGKKNTYYHVYSMKMGQWTRYDDVVVDVYWSFYDCLSHNTRVFHDVLYWSPYVIREWRRHIPGFKYEWRPNKRIVGLNLVTHQLKVVPWMDWLNDYVSAEFFVFNNGCLSLFCRPNMYAPADPSHIWILKQKDNWNSWEKAFTLHVEITYPLVITPTGKFFMLNPVVDEEGQHLCKVRIIDARKNAEEQSRGNNNNNAFVSGLVPTESGIYVESLISPF